MKHLLRNQARRIGGAALDFASTPVIGFGGRSTYRNREHRGGPFSEHGATRTIAVPPTGRRIGHSDWNVDGDRSAILRGAQYILDCACKKRPFSKGRLDISQDANPAAAAPIDSRCRDAHGLLKSCAAGSICASFGSFAAHSAWVCTSANSVSPSLWSSTRSTAAWVNDSAMGKLMPASTRAR